jgi:hypothetical protein
MSHGQLKFKDFISQWEKKSVWTGKLPCCITLYLQSFCFSLFYLFIHIIVIKLCIMHTLSVVSEKYVPLSPSPQSRYTAFSSCQKVPFCHFVVKPPLSPKTSKHWFDFLSLKISFACTGTLYKWDHRLCGLLCLLSFTQHSSFSVHPLTFPFHLSY